MTEASSHVTDEQCGFYTWNNIERDPQVGSSYTGTLVETRKLVEELSETESEVEYHIVFKTYFNGSPTSRSVLIIGDASRTQILNLLHGEKTTPVTIMGNVFGPKCTVTRGTDENNVHFHLSSSIGVLTNVVSIDTLLHNLLNPVEQKIITLYAPNPAYMSSRGN